MRIDENWEVARCLRDNTAPWTEMHREMARWSEKKICPQYDIISRTRETKGICWDDAVHTEELQI